MTNGLKAQEITHIKEMPEGEYRVWVGGKLDQGNKTMRRICRMLRTMKKDHDKDKKSSETSDKAQRKVLGEVSKQAGVNKESINRLWALAVPLAVAIAVLLLEMAWA